MPNPAQEDKDFQNIMKFTLMFEGGQVDDPQDSGGRTNQGVTQVTYNRYRDVHKLIRRDVFVMTNLERDAIYRNQYWEFSDLTDGRDWPLNGVLFDISVLSGPGLGLHFIDRAKREGTIALTDPYRMQKLAACCLRYRAQMFYNLVDARPKDARFLKGWLRRNASLARYTGVTL